MAIKGDSIAGNEQQQKHLMVYDLQAKKIEFAIAICYLESKAHELIEFAMPSHSHSALSLIEGLDRLLRY